MRHVLQAFTMSIGGSDHGYDTEEVTISLPTPVTQEYRGGGMDMAVNLPMAALEAPEVTVKMAGQSPEIMSLLAQAPGTLTRLVFRSAVLEEMGGNTVAHVCVVEGAMNGGSRDAWTRGEKAGLEFMVNGVVYLRYEAGDRLIHELQAYPPKRIVGGVNQLTAINSALGYA